MSILLANNFPPSVLTVPITEASPLVLNSTTTIAAYARVAARNAGVDEDELIATLQCESNLDPEAIGDHGKSFGLAQIHIPAHPDIAKEQALDAKWAIDWTVYQFAKGRQGMWTCWRALYGSVSR